MAQFNPDLPKNEVDFSKSSRGVDPGREVAGPPSKVADESAYYKAKASASQFNSFGEAAKSLINTGIDLYQRNLVEDVQAGAESITQEDNMAIMDQLDAPDMTRDLDAMRGLTAANDAGRISDTHYYARLEGYVRRMKTKYPGHKDLVDKTVEGVVGVTPANALRRALINQLDSLDDRRSKDPRMTEITRLGKEGIQDAVLPDLDEWIAKGELPDLLTISRRENAYKERLARTQRMADEVTANQTIGDFDVKKASSAATAEATLIYDQHLKAALSMKNENGRTFGEALRLATEQFTARGSVDSDLTVQLQSQTAAFRMQLRDVVQANINAKFSGKTDANGKPTVTLPAEERKKVVDSVMANFDSLTDYINNNEMGMANAHARISKAMIEEGGHELLDSNPAIKTLTIWRQQVGPELATVALSQADKTLSQTLGAMMDATTTGIATGEKKSITQELEDAHRKGVDNPQFLHKQMEKFAIILSDERMPAKNVKNVMDALFSPKEQELLAGLDPKERMKVYRLFTSEKMVKSLQARASEDPQGFANYVNWTKSSFMALLRQDAEDARNIVVNSDIAGVTMDEETGHLGLEPRAGSGGLSTLEMTKQKLDLKYADTAIQRLNAEIDGLVPVLKANGEDVGVGVAQVLLDMQLNIHEPTQAGPAIGPFFKWLMDSVVEKVNDNQKALEEGASKSPLD
jgi:hypothetical protein